MVLLVPNNFLGLYPCLWKARPRVRNVCDGTKRLHAEDPVLKAAHVAQD